LIVYVSDAEVQLKLQDLYTEGEVNNKKRLKNSGVFYY